MWSPSLRISACAIPLAILLFGCAGAAQEQGIEITFDGESCRYQGPESVVAGNVVIELTNLTQGYVLLDVYRLDAGKSWEDVLMHLGRPESYALRPSWASGGSNRSVPGNPNAREFHLEVGTYAITCQYMGPRSNGVWPSAPLKVVEPGTG